MPIKAILFDLDNTLYPASCGLMHQIDQRIGEFVRTALQLEETEALELRKHYYATYGTTLRGLQTHYDHIEADVYLQFVHDIAIDRFVAPNTELDPLLNALPLRKIIFTNSPAEHAERVLDCMGIAQHFERTYDVRYFNFVAKPNLAAYEHVLEQIGLAGDETIMIEDTLDNLPPAKQLGMLTILVDESGTVQDGADYIVPDIIAALKIVQHLIDPALPQPKRRKTRHQQRRAAELRSDEASTTTLERPTQHSQA